MAETFEIEEIEEKVILVGVSEQDGDDAEDSLSELAELVKTAGATVVETLIQKREMRHPGTYIGTGKVAELAEDIQSEVIASLSRSDLVQEAEEMKKTVIEAFPDSEMAQEYRELAKTLLKICGVDAC